LVINVRRIQAERIRAPVITLLILVVLVLMHLIIVLRVLGAINSLRHLIAERGLTLTGLLVLGILEGELPI
jgi:phosphotransferase system  glucose/maltose/N-acetylglucosamine-specific IIC component